MNNICITGFGWSGSGAVSDLIREYDDVKYVQFDNGEDFEFRILFEPDGIKTLDLLLNEGYCRFFSYKPIQRFEEMMKANIKRGGYSQIFGSHVEQLTRNYIESLLDYEMERSTAYERMFDSDWKRGVARIKGEINGFLSKCEKIGLIKGGKQIRKYELMKMKVAYKPENFIKSTQDYMESLFNQISYGDIRPLVFDQIFPPDGPERYFKYVPSTFKTIVVVRDPRDTYLLTKCAYGTAPAPMPINNIKDFITFYKKSIYDECKSSNENVLYVYFEDLVYNYEKTKEKIEKFLGISKHARQLTKFDPSVSINNTQLFTKYIEYKKDIEMIEREIPETLYHFRTTINHTSNNIF